MHIACPVCAVCGELPHIVAHGARHRRQLQAADEARPGASLGAGNVPGGALRLKVAEVARQQVRARSRRHDSVVDWCATTEPYIRDLRLDKLDIPSILKV